MRTTLVAVASLTLGLGCSGHITGTSGAGGDGGADPGPDAAWIGGDARFCAQVEVNLTKQIPDVMLLLDQSGSMTAAFGGTNRWEAMYQTLMDPMTGVVKALENDVRFGLALYTSNGGDAGGACPILTEVPVALGNHAAIDAVFGPASPQADTPTGEALEIVAAELAAVPGAMGPKVIVLATDGEPDTCAVPNPQNGQPEAIAGAQLAYAMGIRTYVISVGNEVGAPHLQDMANAGAGLPIGGAVNEPYYRALQPAELVAAFDTIIGGVRSCIFTLDGTVDPTLGQQGSVTLDGQELVYGTDWRLNDSMTLELIGAACDTVLSGGDHELRAHFTCDAIIE